MVNEVTSRDKEVDIEVEVLVIGAGIIGIYQLHKAREAGFDTLLIDAADGVGGVWYWNRYPGARFDSESYTYGYIFSKELFAEWKWEEEFATQPEIERYINHAVDKFDLRKDIRLGERVVSAVYDEREERWNLTTANGTRIRAQFVVSATGGLSVPNYPDLDGLEDFEGLAYHTGAWPKEPIDFAGKRVAIIGNGPSGSQILPKVVDQVEAVHLYMRSPTWCTPLNNAPLSDEKHEQLVADFDQVVHTLMSSPSGFLHPFPSRSWANETPEQRQEMFERAWRSPGFAKFTTNFIELTSDPEVNAEFCRFIANKVRSIVDDPWTAEHLIPKDQLFGAKRPPFIDNYYESFNKPAARLFDLSETPILRVTAKGIETKEGLQEYDIIAFATGFDFGTGALTRMGVKGRDGLDLSTDWSEGPFDWCGFAMHRLPNFFFPGGPHGAGGGNYPRYGQDQVDYITRILVDMRERGARVFEPTQAQEDEWMTMVETLAPQTTFSAKHSHYYGANVKGKPAKYLLNPGGRGKLHELVGRMIESDYEGVLDAHSDAETVGTR